jgi:uncharacterized protein (TIGR03435 family)
MQRFLSLIAAGPGLLIAACLVAQPIPRNLQFDVASLRPSKPGNDRQGYGIRPLPGGQSYEAWNCPIKVMLMAAYRVKAEQIVGGPMWIADERFDMMAKAERSSNPEELHAMLVNMLVDRLNLKFHKEKREMPMYALTADKGGPKMTSHDSANAGDVWIDVNVTGATKVAMKSTYSPMDYFAFRLGTMLDRPVVDLTGLKGGYDFTLEYTQDLPPGLNPNALLNGAPVDTSGPNIFAAVKRQLGLALKAQHGLVDVLVIDHADRPADN